MWSVRSTGRRLASPLLVLGAALGVLAGSSWAAPALAQPPPGDDPDDDRLELRPPELEPPDVDLDEDPVDAGDGDEDDAGDGDEDGPGVEATPDEGDEEPPPAPDPLPPADEEVPPEPSPRRPQGEPRGLPLPTEAAPSDGERLPTEQEAEVEEERPGPPLQTSDPTLYDTEERFAAPTPIFTVHGYLRTRLELQDRFTLGRGNDSDPDFVTASLPGSDQPLGVAPFSQFRFPVDENASGGLLYANMRFRIEPTLSLGEHVRLHAQFDVFDNVVLGGAEARAVYDPFEGFTTSAREAAIVPKRAWAEVTGRGIGQLRFGRMGWHWGLGLLANGGDGIDDDLQTDIDRIMAITKLAGLYWMASWDFVNEGIVSQRGLDLQVPPLDANEGDDITQFTFAVARRLSTEDRLATIARGDVAFEGGALFVYRSNSRVFRLDDSAVGEIPEPDDVVDTQPTIRGYEAFIPDVWARLSVGPLRLGIEAAAVFGTLEQAVSAFDEDDEGRDYLLRQYGVAFESEVRLLDDALGIYLDLGFASGDSDTTGGDDGDPTNTRGLALQNDLFTQDGSSDVVSTYVFHPNYRIDLILWRTIMTRVAGAYYFKPGVSYDFLKSPFGELLQARLDFVWSRASNPAQTYDGREADLGVEIDVRLTYRSEDGPEIWDGFYASLMYGILFPLEGLNTSPGVEDIGLDNAQTVRLLLGVQY